MDSKSKTIIDLDISDEEFKKIFLDRTYEEMEKLFGTSRYVIRKYGKKLGLSKSAGRKIKEIRTKD